MQDKKDKDLWLRQQIKKGNTFTFKQDLKTYCENDVEILLRTTTSFISANFLYQADLVKAFGMPEEWQP